MNFKDIKSSNQDDEGTNDTAVAIQVSNLKAASKRRKHVLNSKSLLNKNKVKSGAFGLAKSPYSSQIFASQKYTGSDEQNQTLNLNQFASNE